MHTHARAKRGPAGRFAFTEAIAKGMSQKAAAAAFCVAPATAHRWWHRRLAAPLWLGPRLVAGATGQAHSTVWEVLHRHGISRAPKDRSLRSRKWMAPGTRVGAEFAHAIVDDHSRLAYVELDDDERPATVIAFLERVLGWVEEHGITTRRLMTDNAFSYVKTRSACAGA